MSKRLLYTLNGNYNGLLRKFLDLQENPRTAWYPSAGTDFHPLLYLSKEFTAISPPGRPEPEPPDIFLFTDYFPWDHSTFLDIPRIYLDNRTEVLVDKMEELPPLNLALDDQIVDFPKGSRATGRVVYLDVRISSNKLGTFNTPVLYVFAENEVFCAEKILPLKIKIPFVIHVRYGGGAGGGGKSTGIWLLNILNHIGCEVFIHDGHFRMQSGDERAMQLYPALSGPCQLPHSETIRTLPGQAWSDYGSVSWDLIK